jgi:hypothetical protein
MYIYCKSCGAKSGYDYDAKAITAWNTRYPKPAYNTITGELARTTVCWCNDCQYGHINEDGITCVNADSEWCTEWRGSFDSCEQCTPRAGAAGDVGEGDAP